MQISVIEAEDFLSWHRNEQEIDRVSFLQTISHLVASYFCMSTELRFLIQLKEELMLFKEFNIESRQKESEFWHSKSLEIAVRFLPSDCPLLNHVLLSYNKHHAPSGARIPEGGQDAEQSLRIIKPLQGIDIAKFQPIIKNVPVQIVFSLNYKPTRSIAETLQSLSNKRKAKTDERERYLF